MGKITRTSIIIPAHNEEERIGETLEEYGKFFQKLKKDKSAQHDFEILVVLNACKDKTIDIVKKAKKKYKEIRFLDLERGGKGYAIVEGFKDAIDRENHIIGFVDADMATRPEEFYDLIAKIGPYDGAIASRNHRLSRTNISFKRRITNKGFNFLVRALLFLPYSDTQCGAKIFRRHAVEHIIKYMGLTQWAFDIDLLCVLKNHGFKVIELPTVWVDKAGSKLDMFKVPFQMFSSIVRLRFLYSPFSHIVDLYDKLPEKIKIHNW